MSDESMPAVLAGACVGEYIAGHRGTAERGVEFPVRKQARVGGDHRSSKLEHQPAVEIESENLGIRFDPREIIPGRRSSSITRQDIHALLDAIADRGSPVMADRLLAAIRRPFNWATERDLVAVSPCEKGKAPAAETSRDRVLSDDELRLVWQVAGPSAGRSGQSYCSF
jgi:hypothetical protein